MFLPIECRVEAAGQYIGLDAPSFQAARGRWFRAILPLPVVLPILLALVTTTVADQAAQAREAADRARALLSAGRPAEALGPARRAAQLDPKNPDGDLLLGFALLGTDGAEEAVAAFQRAVAARPGSVEASGGLAMAYGLLADPRADKAFAAVLAAAPNDARYRQQYAEYLWRADETDRGNLEMERAIQLQPSNPALKAAYGLKLHEEGRFIDAARELARARKAGARDPSLLFFLGSAELENGHFAEAERWLREAISAEPGRVASRQILGLLCLLTGRPADARRELAKAAELEPKSAGVQLDLGRAAEAQGDVEAAEAAYRRALALEPNLYRIHYLLGALLSRRKRVEEARQEMATYDEAYRQEQALLFREGSLRVELNLGWSELRRGRFTEALTQFQRHPDNIGALRGAAAALSHLGRHADAAETLERALLLAPDDHRLRYEIGRERQLEHGK